jgi:hypothetical protein
MSWLLHNNNLEKFPLLTTDEILLTIQFIIGSADVECTGILKSKTTAANKKLRFLIAHRIFCKIFYDFYITGDPIILVEFTRHPWYDFDNMFEIGFDLFQKLNSVTLNNIRIPQILYYINIMNQNSTHFIYYTMNHIDELYRSDDYSVMYIIPLLYNVRYISTEDIQNNTDYNDAETFIRTKIFVHIEEYVYESFFEVYLYIWEGILSNWLWYDIIVEFLNMEHRKKFRLLIKDCILDNRYKGDLFHLGKAIDVDDLKIKILVHLLNNKHTYSYTCEYLSFTQKYPERVTYDTIKKWVNIHCK